MHPFYKQIQQYELKYNWHENPLNIDTHPRTVHAIHHTPHPTRIHTHFVMVEGHYTLWALYNSIHCWNLECQTYKWNTYFYIHTLPFATDFVFNGSDIYKDSTNMKWKYIEFNWLVWKQQSFNIQYPWLDVDIMLTHGNTNYQGLYNDLWRNSKLLANNNEMKSWYYAQNRYVEMKSWYYSQNRHVCVFCSKLGDKNIYTLYLKIPKLQHNWRYHAYITSQNSSGYG